MRSKVGLLYQEYHRDTHFIPSSRRYLFNRPESETKSLGREALAWWVNSVEEARLTQEFWEENQRLQLKRTLFKFLTPRDKSKHVLRNTVSSIKRTNSAENPSTMVKQRTVARRITSVKSDKGRKRVPGWMQNSLFKHGFTKRRSPKVSIGSIPPKQLADGAAEKMDFSGTFLSTTP